MSPAAPARVPWTGPGGSAHVGRAIPVGAPTGIARPTWAGPPGPVQGTRAGAAGDMGKGAAAPFSSFLSRPHAAQAIVPARLAEDAVQAHLVGAAQAEREHAAERQQQ